MKSEENNPTIGKYELSINLIKKASTENHPITLYIECDETTVESYCSDLCTKGFMVDDGYGRRFIPAHRIEDIDVEIIENKNN